LTFTLLPRLSKVGLAMSPAPAGALPEGKTILQVLPALEAGGVERGALKIAAAIREAGARALVVSSGGRMAAGLGADHIALPVHTRNPAGLWRNAAHLREPIRQEGVNLVHARSRGPAWSAPVGSPARTRKRERQRVTVDSISLTAAPYGRRLSPSRRQTPAHTALSIRRFRVGVAVRSEEDYR